MLTPSESSTDAEYTRRRSAPFDPEIPKLLDAIDKAKERLDALPKEEAARKLAATKPPEPPTPKPLPPKPTFEPKTISAEELTQANRESMAAKEKRVRTGYAPIVSTRTFHRRYPQCDGGQVRPCGHRRRCAWIVRNWQAGICSALRNPNVIETLTRPTEAQIAAIPKELRGVDLKPLIEEAQKQGIRVDPRLARFVGAGAAVVGPRTRQLQDMRQPSQ